MTTKYCGELRPRPAQRLNGGVPAAGYDADRLPAGEDGIRRLLISISTEFSLMPVAQEDVPSARRAAKVRGLRPKTGFFRR